MSLVPPERTPRVRAATAMLVAALALTACTAKEQKKPDTAAATPDTTARRLAAPGGAATAAAANLPGALAKAIDSYSGAEFHDFVQALRWAGGHDRQRRCQGDPACAGAKPGKTTQVRVDAVDGQDSITMAGLPSNGVIAARALNKGTLEEERFHLKPGARYEYYLIVYGGDTTGTWKLEEMESQGNAYAHRTVGQGVFRGCHHPFERGARADFKSCAAAAASHTQSLMLQSGSLTDPIWISCSLGCCIMDQSS